MYKNRFECVTIGEKYWKKKSLTIYKDKIINKFF